MKKKVFWTQDELVGMADYLVSRNVEWTNPDIIARVREAQLCRLPQTRQKFIAGRDTIKQMEGPLFDAWNRHRRAENERRKQADAQAEAERRAAEKRAEEDAQRQREAEDAMHAIGLDHPIDQMLNALAQELAGRFTHYLREHMADLLGNKATDAINAILPPDSKMKYTRRRKVLVVGLNSQNSGMIEREYPDIDIKTIGPDYNDTKGAMGSADTVVAMIDYMSHGQADSLKKHPHFVRVNGGMSSLRNILNSIRHKQQGS